MDENCYVFSVVGQVVGFFGSGIFIINNEDLQVGEEFFVISGVVSYFMVLKFIFVFKVNFVWVSFSSDNNVMGLVLVFIFGGDYFDFVIQLNFLYFIMFNGYVKVSGLFLYLVG